MYPLYARYGALNNMHTVLEWYDKSESPPSELLGLTDKPPGTYAPGEQWWPSVGCGPVGKWWALWWTVPDEQATRGGMASSHVALWPLKEIGQVHDITPFLLRLSGLTTLEAVPSKTLMAIYEYRIAEQTNSIVYANLNTWPSLIANIWKKLWPSARQAFSARIGISPPQGGESVLPPCFYGIPAGRAPEWHAYRIVTHDSMINPVSRATHWLIGASDSILDEIIEAIPITGLNLNALTKYARAADHLDAMRKHKNAENAFSLLRTLITLAPEPDGAIQLKIEALEVLGSNIPTADLKVILYLANLPESKLPTSSIPYQAIQNHIQKHAISAPLIQVTDTLKRLSNKTAENWWQNTVQESFTFLLKDSSYESDKAALKWISTSIDIAAYICTLISNHYDFESRLLKVSLGVQITDSTLSVLCEASESYNWSRLNAWVLSTYHSPDIALSKQSQFSGDILPGLQILFNTLDGNIVINWVIENSNQQFIDLVTKRTVKETALLNLLDVSNPNWLKLWLAHTNNGGNLWPTNQDKNSLGKHLIDGIFTNHTPEKLIDALASDLAPIVYQYSKRSELWDYLSIQSKNVMTSFVAEEIIKLCESNSNVQMPEKIIVEAIMRTANSRSIQINAIICILSWETPINEQDAIRWLSNKNITSVAGELSRIIAKRGWRNVAKQLFPEYKKKPKTLGGLFSVCLDLLPSWDRYFYSRQTPEHSTIIDNRLPLIQRAAELGAYLYPAQLEYIWGRAGGKVQHLQQHGTPSTQWLEAAKLADHGALQGGLLKLAQTLQEDYPHNEDIRELIELARQ